MHPMKKLIVTVAAFLIATAGQSLDQRVTMTVEHDDGPPSTLPMADRPIELRTNAGRIRLTPLQIRSITATDTAGIYNVITASGDIWVAELVHPGLFYFADEAATQPQPYLERFRRLVNDAAVPVKPAFGQSLVTLRDGSRFRADTRDALLTIGTDTGTWDFPMASAASMEWRHATDTSTVEITFSTGRHENVRLARHTPDARMTDAFGNALVVPMGVLARVVNRTPSGTAPDTTAQTPPEVSNRVYVAADDGELLAVSSPLVVWTLETNGGRVRIPSTHLRRVRRSPDRRSGFILDTVYGERLSGSLEPVRLPLAPAQGGAKHLRMDRSQSLIYRHPLVPIPSGWLVWRFVNGDAFCARFADGSITMRRSSPGSKPETIPQAQVTFLRAGHPLSVITQDSELHWGEPTEPTVELVTLSGGATLRVAWSAIEYAAGGLSTVSREMRIPPPPARRDHASSSPLADGLRSPGDASDPETVPDVDPLAALPIEELNFDDDDVRNRLESESPTDFVRHTLAILDRLVDTHVRTRRDQAVARAKADIQVNALTNRVTELEARIAELENAEQACRTALNRREEELSQARQQASGAKDEDSRLIAGLRKELELANRQLSEHAETVIPPAGAPPAPVAASAPPAQSKPEPADTAPSLTPKSSGENRRVAVRDPSQPGRILIMGGSFNLGRTRGDGARDEVPPVRVEVKPFYMDIGEVTRAEFADFVRDTKYLTDREHRRVKPDWREPGFEQGNDEPVVFVSWMDAITYCNWLSLRNQLTPCYEVDDTGETVVFRREANGYRLPTEAEWEFAARNAGQDVIYPWGDEADVATIIQWANFMQQEGEPNDAWPGPNPVMALPANRIGLFGMAGNVWEWCSDWYVEDAYSTIFAVQSVNPCVGDDEARPSKADRRVMRGGSFRNGISMLRCAARGNGDPAASANRVGFRTARNADTGVPVNP